MIIESGAWKHINQACAWFNRWQIGNRLQTNIFLSPWY